MNHDEMTVKSKERRNDPIEAKFSYMYRAAGAANVWCNLSSIGSGGYSLLF